MMHFDFRSRPKQGRELEPELRRIIDEAVAAGRVKVIPQGASSVPGYRWSEKENRIVCCDNRTAAEKAQAARINYEKARQALNERRAEEARKRWSEIAAMAAQGMTARKIAEARGETLFAIKAAMQRLRAARVSDPDGGVK